MDVIFLMSFFRLYPGIKMSFEHHSVHKNFFLSARFCWDSRLFLCEMDQKLNFGGLIGYGNSYLDSVFRCSKVFRLYAKVHDPAGAVRAPCGKGPGYCYMIRRGPNSCFLDWTTVLSLHKTLSTLHFPLWRLLKQYDLHCTSYRDS